MTKFEPGDPDPSGTSLRGSAVVAAARREIAIELEPKVSPAAWLKERFGWRKKKAFWIIFACMCLVTFASSGYLIAIVLAGLSWLAFKLPALAPLTSAIYNSGLMLTAQNMTQYSPLDQAFGAFVSWVDKLGPATQGCLQYALLAVGTLMLTRSANFAPSQILIGTEGLRLKWSRLLLKTEGPLVPWEEIKAIRLISARRATASHDMFIEFEYVNARWQYFLTSSVSKAARNLIRVRLSQLEQSPQREEVLALIQEKAPPYVTDAAVLEAIAPSSSQSYTELWLTALTAPSKRERTEPLPPGTTLHNGEYTVLSQLGVGGQGIAYVAHGKPETISHTIRVAEQERAFCAAKEGARSEKEVVLKELVLPLFVETDARKSALEKFLKEAELLRSLDHRQIVKLSHCFVEDHRGYLVLEKINGASLKDIVAEQGAMTEARVLELLEQMLDILDYMHGREPPVVHRDFTPDNLLLDADGLLKLVDFNVAQQADDGVTGTVVGKHCYVPPEQIRGMATIQSDIYAMGATLFFLLTGQEPEPLSVSHPKERNESISESLDSLVARATQLEPEDRFQCSADVRTKLHALKDGVESPA